MEIGSYKNSPKAKMNTEFIRDGYFQRELQIRTDVEQAVRKERIINDPIMLPSCFVQHLSYHNQEFFFQIHGPLKRCELLKDLRNQPLSVWLRKHLI
ncbi:MAG: hypothetical protein WA364_06220 [Candidatus Nitrosopolaris sp.]